MKNQYKYISLFVLLLSCMLECLAGGFIVVDNNKRAKCATCATMHEYTLELQSEDVKVQIQDDKAYTSIEQSFFYPNNRRVDGYFYFPIPKNRLLQNFTVEFNNQKINPEKLSIEDTQITLQDIVEKHLDPSLLELSGQEVYRFKINSIESRSLHTVYINYAEDLSKEGNQTMYEYPFHIQKRQIVPVEKINFKIDINTTEPIKDIYSPTFAIEAARTDRTVALGVFEAENYLIKNDFKLYYTTDEKDVGSTVMCFDESAEEKGYFYLNLTPATEIKNFRIVEKDITFVLDCSGSMVGTKMEQAKNALQFCVNNLNAKDRFNIVRFSTEAEALFKELKPFDSTSLAQAVDYIQGLKATGGTNIDEALDLALDVEKTDDRPYMIVFITDGKPTIGVTQELPLVESVARNNKNNAKIFTFGLGDDLNALLLDRITETTKAYRTYIAEDEDIEIKLTNFYNKVSSPILTDVKLTVEGVEVSDIYPRDLPDLFIGSSLLVFGRYEEGGAATIKLEGKMNGEDRTFTFDANFDKMNETNDFVAPLWAARRIGFLLDQIRWHGENREFKAEIVTLSKQYGIITPYTSHLILQAEERQANEADAAQPNRIFDKSIIGKKSTFRIETSKEYNNMLTKREGAESVQSSKEVNMMNNATNIAQITPGQYRLNYTDNKGKIRNISEQVINIKHRPFYSNNDVWVDSKLSKMDKLNAQRIEFNTPEYFALLSKDNEVASYLALGRNVQFLHEGVVYEIYE